MRLFAVREKGEFVEYQEQVFKDEHHEEAIETWLETNPDSIVEDGKLLIIGRQVSTNLGAFIDLLALDRDGNVAVLELKRDKTPRETLAQALEYASFAATLDYDQLQQVYQTYTGDESVSLAEYHKTSFGLEDAEAVSFNKDQRIVIVGSEITPPIRETATFLRQRGLRVTCLEFGYFQTRAGEQLLSMDIAVGREPVKPQRVSTATLPRTDKDKFLAACDEAGRAVFEPILALSDSEALPIHWGTRGFSLNVDIGGNHIALCIGYPRPTKSNQPPQLLRTTFKEISKKTDNASALIETFQQKLLGTGLFVAGGHELKYVIQGKPSEEKVRAVVEIFKALAQEVRALAESDEA